MKKYMRHPRTKAEKKANIYNKLEFDDLKIKFCRARRNSKNLPTSWDDVWKFNERCWKKFRKTKYKG